MKNTILIFLFQLLFVFSFKAQELKIGFDYKPGFSIQNTNWNKYYLRFYQYCSHLCSPIYMLDGGGGFVNSYNFNVSYLFNNYFSMESGIGITNRNQTRLVAETKEKQRTNHYYYSFPVLGNFWYKNFYLGAGASVNSYFISKNSWGWNTDGTFPDTENTISLALISQIGYNYQLYEKIHLNFGLYFDYLLEGKNVASYKNYGLNLGVRYQIYKNQE